MTNLSIELSTSSVENITSLILEKLYLLALTSKVLDSNNTLTISLKGNVLAPSAYLDTVDYLRTKFPQLTINILDNNFYIRFADPEVARVMLSQISSDGIGVSKTDAQRLTALPNELFKDNTTILTFDELSEFGNITIGDRTFNKCTNLTSIDLSNVTRFTGFYSFSECTNLAIKINIPNLVSLGNCTFSKSGITEVEDFGNITIIPGYNGATFNSCPNLTKVILPTSCVTLGQGCFGECNNLKYIGPTTYLTTLEKTCLRTRGNIPMIMNFSNVINLYAICANVGHMTGSSRTIFKLMYLPKVVNPASNEGRIRTNNTYYREGTFLDIGTDLLYLRDILHFYGASFHNSQITALVINNVTPPTVHYHKNYTLLEYEDWVSSNNLGALAGTPTDLFMDSSITTIYVPDSAVTTYKTDPIWSTWASQIDSMNNLTKVATEEDLQPNLIALIEAYM